MPMRRGNRYGPSKQHKEGSQVVVEGETKIETPDHAEGVPQVIDKRNHRGRRLQLRQICEINDVWFASRH